MMEVVPDIPDIRDYPDLIRQAADRKLTLFIGAGISRFLKPPCPSWQAMGQDILKGLFDAEVVSYREYSYLRDLGSQDPKLLLSMIWRKAIHTDRREYDLQGHLKRMFSRNCKAAVYDILCRMDAALVTTNYDTGLRDSMLRKLRVDAEPSSVDGEIAVHATDNTARGSIHFNPYQLSDSNIENGHVYQIHGSVADYNTMVVTHEHYLRVYERGGKLAEFLNTLFADRTVLFIGYSLKEMEVLEFVRSRTPSGGTSGLPEHYVLKGASRHDTDLVEYQKEYHRQLGIELIPFCTDGIGHAQVERILSQWSGELESEKSTPGFFEGKRFLDGVLAKRT